MNRLASILLVLITALVLNSLSSLDKILPLLKVLRMFSSEVLSIARFGALLATLSGT
ncbi:hypothetical protein EK21DRAFT_119794 [Setomelanomma holmii]|uniref:Uncharacterized protein n=1 Tax=Setomelanomma holmii TaxID=210430 RepID=A0A9P4LFB7_9PLEO|nr:hypothetical protein EK21DRAFT_119794 [Setomelanomma holmii]